MIQHRGREASLTYKIHHLVNENVVSVPVLQLGACEPVNLYRRGS